VAVEVYLALGDRPPARLLERASAHIAEQQQILFAEQARAGAWTEKPSDWIVAREQREYELADGIIVLGTFPERSFLDRGIDAGKLHRTHLGVNVRAFQASPAVVADRQRRIRGGQPLRVLNVGTFCLRKGAFDFLTLMRAADRRRFHFRFVGPVSSDARRLWRDAKGLGEFVGKRPQDALPAEYAWGDLFLLPTLEDGFAVVVTQALASALPVVVTSNCGAADLVEEGRNGWVVPIRRADLLLERLQWCDEHREALADAVSAAQQCAVNWDWSQTACEVEQVYLRVLAKKAAGTTRGRNAV
jgi:glycosyltransferase involved in cell wall biosynthesis